MSHQHTAACWSGSYEPCGEHHAHDYNCGHGGSLTKKCPDYKVRWLRVWLDKNVPGLAPTIAYVELEPVDDVDEVGAAALETLVENECGTGWELAPESEVPETEKV